MSTYTKSEHWADSANKLFPYQVGFTAPPHDFDAAPSDFLRIPFLPQALSWERGARDKVSWWDGGSFHENLRNSDGLRAQPKTSIDISEAPTRVREVVAELRPHYEHLYQHRLQLPASAQ